MITTHTQQGYKEQGFTLVETLVAMTLLIGVIVGAFSAIQTGLGESTYSREDVTAYYIAQEGIEEIRNLRDENLIAGNGFMQGIAAQAGDACFGGSPCMVDAVSNALSACGAGTCPVLRTDLSTSSADPFAGMYGYDASWTATPFTRTITITPIGVNGEEYKITVEVTWVKGGSTRSFTVSENLFNTK